MNLAAIAFTADGLALGRRLAAALPEDTLALSAGFGPDKVGFRTWTAENFPCRDGLVFIGATGIAVRAVAPHLVSKTSDPAVLVLDDLGRFCIPLVSGHLGGANALARRVAARLGATPVITTATDGHGLFAVDTWAKSQGLRILNPAGIKAVSSRLLAGETVRLRSRFPLAGRPPAGVTVTDEAPWDVSIDLGTREAPLCLVPRAVWVGAGCRRGVPAESLARSLEALLREAGVDRRALAGLCTIDRKADEPGLLALAESLGLPLTTYTAEQLRAVPGAFTASDFVRKTVGVDNVCERSAVLGSGGGRLIAKKHAEGGVTMALALADVALRLEEEP